MRVERDRGGEEDGDLNSRQVSSFQEARQIPGRINVLNPPLHTLWPNFRTLNETLKIPSKEKDFLQRPGLSGCLSVAPREVIGIHCAHSTNCQLRIVCFFDINLR